MKKNEQDSPRMFFICHGNKNVDRRWLSFFLLFFGSHPRWKEKKKYVSTVNGDNEPDHHSDDDDVLIQ